MSSTALAKPSSAPTALSQRFTAPAPAPVTPAQQASPAPAAASASAPAVTSTPQPGTWRHPGLDEIARRQNATVFNGDNINRIVVSAVTLIASVYVPSLAYNSTPSAIISLLNSSGPYTQYTLLACRLLLVINIVVACSPLFRAKDEIEDIPLTPSQRALLGLKPSSAPLTPGQQYITPPRYARSSTPRSNASAQRLASPSASPSARTASPSSVDRSAYGQSKGASGSPYSVSPLMQRALGGASANRRLSYGSSPLDGNAGLPATPPTGLANGKASVGLNSKWLYERGRGSPNGKALFT